MKKILLAASIITLSLGLSACGKSTEDSAANAKDGKSALKYHGEPGLVTPAELAEDLGYFKKVSLDYQGVAKGGPESIQFVATKQLDFGNAFDGAIIKSIEKNVKIKAVITSYGSSEENYVGFFAKKGTKITTAKDLINKKIAVNIRGAHYEMLLKKYFKSEGLTDEEIDTIEFVTLPIVNSEQAVINGQVDLATLNNVFRDKALKNGQTELVFSDLDALGGSYNAGGYFFREDFIQSNKEEVADFTQGVAKAYEWMAATDDKTVIAKMQEIMEKRNRDEPIENIQYWKDSGVVTKGGKISAEDYKRWLQPLVDQQELQSTNINVKKYYTNEFNPY